MQETEVKFCVRSMIDIESRLRQLGARLQQSRQHELNLRFDNAKGDFHRQGRVLRLRQDDTARLTYQDEGKLNYGALSRREIEFTVDDFDSARQFIEALGYQVVFTYEKDRTIYSLLQQTSEVFAQHPRSGRDLGGLEAHIMLDELPYGDFVEIEGEFELLRLIAEELQLNWDKAIPASYHTLFERLCKSRRLIFRDLTFENLKDIKVSPRDMMIEYADHEAMT